MAANSGAGQGADFAALVGRQSLTTQHAELFQSYIPGEPTGSMIINPHSASPHQKKVFSPATFDLRNDIYAPRALGYAAAKMTTTFPQGDTGGSFAGSPPRARDKFIPGSSDITATAHADLKKSWFEGNKKGGKNGPRSHKDGRISQGLHSVNDRVFLRGDPWVRHTALTTAAPTSAPQRNCRQPAPPAQLPPLPTPGHCGYPVGCCAGQRLLRATGAVGRPILTCALAPSSPSPSRMCAGVSLMSQLIQEHTTEQEASPEGREMT